MSRTLSSTGNTAINAADSDAVFVHLLDITPSTGTVIRLTDNSEDVQYGGNTYTTFPFTLILPSDENGVLSQANLVIDNISRTLVDEIRNLTASLQVDLYVVDASQLPVTLEASYSGFNLKNVTYDAMTITGTLTLEDYLAEPFPKDILSGANYPGLL